MAIGSDCRVIFTDVNTFGVFALDYEAETENVQVTPLVEANAKLRFADFDMHPINNRWTLAMREVHRDGDEVEKVKNEIVVINVESKESKVVVTGYWQLYYSDDGNDRVQHLNLKGMNDTGFQILSSFGKGSSPIQV